MLTLDQPRSIHYRWIKGHRWIKGPLADVEETMGFEATDERSTRYSGSFTVRPGMIGWVVGLVWVRPLFDRLVARHLRQAQTVAEERARRSRVFAPPYTHDPDA